MTAATKASLSKVDLSHKTRFSDSSIYDVKCIWCGGTDANGDRSFFSFCPNSQAKFFSSLHEANVARDKEWNPGNKLSLYFRANELFGEGGELGNILKKLEREDLGLVGSRSERTAMVEEMADVVICCYLIALHTNIEMDRKIASSKPMEDDLSNYSRAGTMLANRIGSVCGFVEHHPEVRTSLDQILLADKLAAVVGLIYRLAEQNGIAIDRAIADKFNKTSVKRGLTVFMEVA